MEDSHNQNAFRLGKVEHRMSTGLEPSQTGSDQTALATNGWILRHKLKAFFYPFKVNIRLSPSPGVRCEGGDFVDIVLSFNG